MKETIIKDYLGAIELASNVGSKTKTYKAFADARLKLYDSLDSTAKLATNKKKGNTTFEVLTCVGFYPQERRLTATLKINKPYGYAGNCPNGLGSYEYVAFYVNWNGDSDYNDTGENVNSSYVHIFDPGNQINKTGPICYSVYRDIIPPPTVKDCAVVNVRAILSWQVMPTGPNFIPTWGNVIDCPIRIQAIQ